MWRSITAIFTHYARGNLPRNCGIIEKHISGLIGMIPLIVYYACPSAIQADVIDYDDYLTGRRQEGWYIGIWSVVKVLRSHRGRGGSHDTRHGGIRSG
jgi:hypothetical protein